MASTHSAGAAPVRLGPKTRDRSRWPATAPTAASNRPGVTTQISAIVSARPAGSPSLRRRAASGSRKFATARPMNTGTLQAVEIAA